MRCLVWSLLVSCASPHSASAPDGSIQSPDAPDQPVPPVGQIQMNDLSVLFPLATSEADFATYLSARSPGVSGVLVPQQLYSVNSPPAGEIDYDLLRLVALRFDPCAPLGPTTTGPCQNQLRLVFQLLQFAGSATTATDAGVHVTYALTRAQLVTAVNEIAAAREVTTTTDLGPLAVNPIIASQGLGGAMADRVRAVVAEYADNANIVRITAFLAAPNLGRADAPTPSSVFWQFGGIEVAGGAGSTMTIPTLNDDTGMSLHVSTAPLESLFGPGTSSADNLDLLASVDQAAASTASARQAAFDAALRIENPTRNSVNTIDCASCHMAEPSRRLVGEQLFGLSAAGNANAFVADPRIPSADLTTTTTLIGADSNLNIHAFSYRGSSPMINQRVVNDTAANLSYLESL